MKKLCNPNHFEILYPIDNIISIKTKKFNIKTQNNSVKPNENNASKKI